MRRDASRKRIRDKSVERAVKRGLIRAMRVLVRSMRSRTGLPPPPDWDSGAPRVLYLRYDHVGDMILATGIIRGIAAAHPRLMVDVLASRSNASVLAGNPYIGRVVLFEKKRPWTWLRTLRAIRGARYDAVIDTKVRSPSFTDAAIMLLSGARHRIGVAGRATDVVLTLPVAPTRGAVHYVDYSTALATAFGVPVEDRDWRPEIVLRPDERVWAEARWREAGEGTRLLVNVSAGDRSRYWPWDRFAAAVRALRAARGDRALVALVVGTPSDQVRAERIAAASGGMAVATRSVRDAFALVEASDAVLTADTSITHAASAFGKPAVALFPLGRGALYGPYRTGGRVVSTPAPAIDSLPAEPVIRALTEVVR